MNAGSWMLDMLGAVVVVGSGMMVVGGSAFVFALVRIAGAADGLAGTRDLSPPLVRAHAEEIRGRIRSRYMLRTRPLGDPAAHGYVAFEIEVGDPIAMLIAAGATMPITSLPPLNESLRRGLAARAGRPTRAAEPPEPLRSPRPRRVRRKARRAKVANAARS